VQRIQAPNWGSKQSKPSGTNICKGFAETFEQEYKRVAVDEPFAAATVEALLTSCYCH